MHYASITPFKRLFFLKKESFKTPGFGEQAVSQVLSHCPFSSPTGWRRPRLAPICCALSPFCVDDCHPQDPLLVSTLSREAAPQGQCPLKKDLGLSHLQGDCTGSRAEGARGPGVSDTPSSTRGPICSMKALSPKPLRGGFRKPTSQTGRPCSVRPAGLGAREHAWGTLLVISNLLGDEAVVWARQDPTGSQGGVPAAFGSLSSPPTTPVTMPPSETATLATRSGHPALSPMRKSHVRPGPLLPWSLPKSQPSAWSKVPTQVLPVE